MKITVLGGGGCFAINFAKHAMSLGHRVFGIGRSGLRKAFSQGIRDYRYKQWAIGPDTEFIMDALIAEKPDVVVNFAAQGEGAASFRPVRNWKYFFHTNGTALVDLTAQIYENLPETRFIQIGTSELYGSCPEPVDEEAPLKPSSPYSASKAAFDLHLQAVHKVLGFKMNIIRPCNCYVEGQQLHRIIPKALLYALTGKTLPLHGGGKAEKSYLHATDLSTAIMTVIDKGVLGEIYNVGAAKPTAIRDVVELCAGISGVQLTKLAEITEERTGQDSRYWLNCKKIRALGWYPQVSWQQGLTEVHNWIAENLTELSELNTDFVMRA